MEKKDLYGTLCGLLEYLLEKKTLSQITYANHMTMTTSRQIWSWPDYHKGKTLGSKEVSPICST